jgi:hypothetical protein
VIHDGESYAPFQRCRLGIRYPMLYTLIAILEKPDEAGAATFRERRI